MLNLSQLFTRRRLLGAAGAALLPVLPGCGNGDDDNQFTSDGQLIVPRNDVGEMEHMEQIEQTQQGDLVNAQELNPTYALPFSRTRREVYQVEVVINRGHRANAFAVTLRKFDGNIHTNHAILRQYTKNVDHSNNHEITFATLDNTPTSMLGGNTVTDRGVLRDQLYIEVYHSRIVNNDGTVVKHTGGFQLGRVHNGQGVRNDHRQPNGLSEYEWLVNFTENVTSDNFDVAIRFFKLPENEYGGRRELFISAVTTGNATHSNSSGHKAYTYIPKYHDLSPTITRGNRAQVIKHLSGFDTLMIPSDRTNDHFELMPSFHQVRKDENLKAYVMRRAERHLTTLYKANNFNPISDEQFAVYGTGHPFMDDLFTVYFGKTGSDALAFQREAMRKLVANTDFDINEALEKVLKDAVAKYDTDENYGALSRRMQEMDTEATSNRTFSPRQGTVGLVVQFYAGVQNLPFWAGWPNAAGIRLSLPINRRTRIWAAGKVYDSSYRVVASDNVKLSYTGVIGTGSFKSWLAGQVDIVKPAFLSFIDQDMSIDVEFSVNTRITDGKVRVDSLVFEPVIDVAFGKYISKFMLDMIEPHIPSDFSIPDNLPQISGQNSYSGLSNIISALSARTWFGVTAAFKKSIAAIYTYLVGNTTNVTVFEMVPFQKQSR